TQPGTYQITEDASTLPATIVENGTTFFVQNAFRNTAGTVNGQTRGVALPGQDVIDTITLNPGETDINNSFGENCIQAAHISGYAYSDTDGNHVRDAHDPG